MTDEAVINSQVGSDSASDVTSPAPIALLSPTDEIERPAWSEAAYRHLLNADGPMAALVQRQGQVIRPIVRTSFARLVRAIVGQQISVAAAATIYARFIALTGDPPTPTAIGMVSDEAIRAAGFSKAKLLSVRDLSEHALDGRLDLAHLDQLPDEEVVTQLISVRGIGRWTAEMFLMFSLGRPDVLAADDLGVQAGLQRLYELEKRPGPAQVREIAARGSWHPYATAACYQLWESLKNNPAL